MCVFLFCQELLIDLNGKQSLDVCMSQGCLYRKVSYLSIPVTEKYFGMGKCAFRRLCFLPLEWCDFSCTKLTKWCPIIQQEISLSFLSVSALIASCLSRPLRHLFATASFEMRLLFLISKYYFTLFFIQLISFTSFSLTECFMNAK